MKPLSFGNHIPRIEKYPACFTVTVFDRHSRENKNWNDGQKTISCNCYNNFPLPLFSITMPPPH